MKLVMKVKYLTGERTDENDPFSFQTQAWTTEASVELSDRAILRRIWIENDTGTIVDLPFYVEMGG